MAGVFESPLGEQADAPLVPNLGEPGCVVDQGRRLAHRLLILRAVVQPADAGQVLPLAGVAVAPPESPDAVVGQQPHAAVAIDEGPPEHAVVAIVAEKAQRHDRRPPRHVVASRGQPLERAGQVVLRYGGDERGRVLVLQVAVIQPLQQRSRWQMTRADETPNSCGTGAWQT